MLLHIQLLSILNVRLCRLLSVSLTYQKILKKILFCPFSFVISKIDLLSDISFFPSPLKSLNQSHTRYSEPDNRDWRGRSGQVSSYGEEKSWDTIRENKVSYGSNSTQQEQFNRHDQLNSQSSSRVQVSSNQGVILTSPICLLKI